ncbi:CaiB/BaiF CoA-transferase family protein [Dactylosporangium sp. NPDC000555]|uniref:CaiB/BaiF CoA transferase family protein n=1 Tax=Dactylosporangium sp. NPDC000555 TaxID=3154260 RepID=UPI00331EAAE6
MTNENRLKPGPLDGIRVIEIAGIGPSPYAAMLLAELGADVVRVDRPGGAGLPHAPSDALNRSRPNLAIDLKHPRATDVLFRLVRHADVLIEGFRPGVAERLGIGPADCHAINPGLVYARMTGWGQDGPLAVRAGHDITYAALTGALHVSGGTDKPRQAANLIADFAGGSMFLVVGILAALLERSRSGAGQIVDAAMVDGAASLMTMLYGMHAHGVWRDEREANLVDGGAPFYDTYRCKDGKFVAVGAIEPQFFAQLLTGLDLEFDQFDRASWPAMRDAFKDTFAGRTRDEWARHFEGTDACVAPVLSLAEAPSHPHMAARGVFHQLADGYEPQVAPRFSRTPGRLPGSVRTVGQDSASVLAQAGFSPAEIEEMAREGVVHLARSS